MNAVYQCLLHCDASRNWLRNGIEASSVADEAPREFLTELQNVGRSLADGVPTGVADERCRFDILSPHALIDSFLRCRPLALDQPHDAREVLEEILTCTRMGQEFFNTGCQHFQRSDIVSLPTFFEDGWWYNKNGWCVCSGPCHESTPGCVTPWCRCLAKSVRALAESPHDVAPLILQGKPSSRTRFDARLCFAESRARFGVLFSH